ncbi:PREDICTED: uncharacterized protein LOC109488270, partial [Branchiostoma belcheri]|uniref:Uncharacterized protein LOC109488270 n=1 Tax=Branchiostoma belcheri TaxID=7741 RepID=A0A6P5AE53_BRABE
MLDEGYYVTPGTGQVLYVERTTVEGSSGTEATTLAPEEADSGVAMVKRHFVGKFEIPVDGTVSPHWRRLCRHPDLHHVRDLKAKFKATRDMSTRYWLSTFSGSRRRPFEFCLTRSSHTPLVSA